MSCGVRSSELDFPELQTGDLDMEPIRSRKLFVQVSCGSIVPLEVPLGATDEQVLDQFRKGQLVAALTCLLIGTPMLLFFTFVR